MLMLALAVPAAAQVDVEGVKMGLSGEIDMGYGGDLSNQGGSDHGLGLGGNGTLQGFYYNPNFLSYNLQPYYSRAQANSTGASIFDSGGYTGNVNFFTGSNFPGSINFAQVWDSTGIFGIPGAAGLTTRDSNRNFGIGWSALVPGLPTLSVSYGHSSGSSSLLGSDEQSDIATNSFGVRSSYRVDGWNLGAGFGHMSSDTNANGFGGNESTNTSTNSYSVSAGHKFPLNGGFGLGVTRTDYNSSYTGDASGRDNGTTDNAYGNLNFNLWRLPITTTATYTDNVYGSLEQQILASGGTLLFSSLTPESRALVVNAGTGYAIAPHVYVNGYVNRQELWMGGQSFGLTQFGANIGANFGKFFKGLSVTVGMNDGANRAGNIGAGLVANATYNRQIDRWELSANYNYNQNVQTLLAIYQTSSMSYGGQVRRKFQNGFQFNLGGGGGHTAFVQTKGDTSHGESANASVSWHRTTLAANYSQSYGASVLTPNGLVPVPVPGQLITNNLVIFNGKSHGFNFGTSPRRNLTLALTYSKANSSTLGFSPNTLTSSNETELYSGLLTYRLRKVYFNASVVQFRQGISASGTPPTVVTSYYFGISRWFKGF